MEEEKQENEKDEEGSGRRRKNFSVTSKMRERKGG